LSIVFPPNFLVMKNNSRFGGEGATNKKTPANPEKVCRG
jgi:hypothetical protein